VAGGNYFHDNFNFQSFFSVGLTALVPVVDPNTGTFLTPEGEAFTYGKADKGFRNGWFVARGA